MGVDCVGCLLSIASVPNNPSPLNPASSYIWHTSSESCLPILLPSIIPSRRLQICSFQQPPTLSSIAPFILPTSIHQKPPASTDRSELSVWLTGPGVTAFIISSFTSSSLRLSETTYYAFATSSDFLHLKSEAITSSTDTTNNAGCSRPSSPEPSELSLCRLEHGRRKSAGNAATSLCIENFHSNFADSK